MSWSDMVKQGIDPGTAFLILMGMTLITGVIVPVVLMALQTYWNRVTVGGLTHEIESVKAAVASSTGQRVKIRDFELKAFEDFDHALRRYFTDHFVERPTAVGFAIDSGGRVRHAWFDNEVTGTALIMALTRVLVFRTRQPDLVNAAGVVCKRASDAREILTRHAKVLADRQEQLVNELQRTKVAPEIATAVTVFLGEAKQTSNDVQDAYSDFANAFAKYLAEEYPDVHKTT